MGQNNRIFGQWYQDALCDDNTFCTAERDAKQRGTWFFEMYVSGSEDVTELNGNGTTLFWGTFEILQFAQTFKRLDNFADEDDNIQLNQRAAAIYTTLNLIKKGETMAFVKMPDWYSSHLVTVQQQHKSLGECKFSAKKFSPNGGVMFRFDLKMESVFILDIQRDGVVEKILITFSNTRFRSKTQESEQDELQRVMNR